MKMLQPLRFLAVLGFFVMVLMPAAGMAQSAATEFGIYVPHNSGDNGAHNDVTVGPCMQTNDGIDVSFKAGNPPKPVIQKVRIGRPTSIDLGGGGNGGAGRVIGTLNAYQEGTATYVTYTGFISGWWGYDFQPKVVFPVEKPLIVCVLPQ